jgi:protein FRG1
MDICLNCTEDNQVLLRKLEVESEEPFESSQVLVAQSVSNATISLKTMHDKYLSCDRFGVVIADSEAVGPQEEWTVIKKEDGVSFMSHYSKFLKVDLEELCLRCDSENSGYLETFQVKFQSKNRPVDKEAIAKAKKTYDYSEMDEKAVELDLIQKYHNVLGSNATLSREDMKELKKAKAQGRLHEALLERRIKMKPDKFCY